MKAQNRVKEIYKILDRLDRISDRTRKTINRDVYHNLEAYRAKANYELSRYSIRERHHVLDLKWAAIRRNRKLGQQGLGLRHILSWARLHNVEYAKDSETFKRLRATMPERKMRLHYMAWHETDVIDVYDIMVRIINSDARKIYTVFARLQRMYDRWGESVIYRVHIEAAKKAGAFHIANAGAHSTQLKYYTEPLTDFQVRRDMKKVMKNAK